MKPIYFKNLNGFRAIASLIVVIWHIDQFSYLFNIEKIGFHENGMAGNAVDMFFVLSGFLITYLLLKEKKETKNISIKSFYLRRVYRILPLYYLTIIISILLIYFEIIPYPSYFKNSILLYLFLLANVAYVLKLTIPSITPLWSVGVEEQFYGIWPHFIKHTNKYINFFILFIVIFMILKLALYLYLGTTSTIYKLLITTRFNIMCLGAIGAYLVFTKNNVLNLIFKKEVQYISWLVLLTSILYKPIHLFSFIDKELNSTIYLIIILNISSNPKNIVSLENKIMNYIGKISYGIYVYHMILIYFLSNILSEYQIHKIVIFPLIIISTIVISWLSYQFFEQPFLKIKKNTL